MPTLSRNKDYQISAREQEVVQLLCQGLTTKEIASELCLSEHTVVSHKKNMMMKEGARNKVRMVYKVLLSLVAPMNMVIWCTCIITLMLSISVTVVNAQSPVLFEVESRDKGILIPSLMDTAIANPVEGLVIYNEDHQQINWWHKAGFWVSLPQYIPGSSGIQILEQPFHYNHGNLIFTRGGAQHIDTSGGSGFGNTVMGTYAARDITTSSANTFIGLAAGENQKNGYGNTYIGFKAGQLADSSQVNTFIGREAGAKVLRGSSNVAIGQRALWEASSAHSNISLGHESMSNVDTSWSNIAIGAHTLQNGQKDIGANVVIGPGAMQNFKQGWDNIVIGNSAGQNADTMYASILIGWQAGMESKDGYNVMIGSRAGLSNTVGRANTFIGHGTGQGNIDGNQNTFLGLNAGHQNVSGFNNTYVGDGAGFTSRGNNNILIGRLTGVHSSMPTKNFNGNIFIGNEAGRSETNSNRLYIENSSDTNPLIYGEFDNDKVQINGSLKITEVINLKASADVPLLPQEGDVYMDDGTNRVGIGLRYFDGSDWVDL